MSDEFTLYLGDCLAGLAGVEAESVDAIVTDPPAGIGFMGREWDSNKGGRVSWIAWMESVMREALRVLKPGAHGLVWALPRTSHWTATALEQAGFEVRDVITHHYGVGFPKSLNVDRELAKKGDACACKETESDLRNVPRSVPSEEQESAERSEVLQSVLLREGALDSTGHAESHGSDRQFREGGLDGSIETVLPEEDDRVSQSCVEGWSHPQEGDGQLQRSDLRSVPDGIPGDGERRRVRHGAPAGNGAVDPEVSDQDGGGSSPRPRSVEQRAGEPPALCDESGSQTCRGCGKTRRWRGLGTGLKPASEHWLLVRKPLSGTVAANVQEHGTGALNIDACRIEGAERAKIDATARVISGDGRFGTMAGSRADGTTSEGRWPANLALSHTEWCEPAACLPGCPVALLDAQSGTLSSGGYPPEGGQRSHISTFGKPNTRGPAKFGASEGGASRFFYVSKPTTEEREENVRDLPKRSAGELVDREAGSAGMSNPRAGAGRTSRGRANIHPTVKSVALMSWLITLVTPPGGVVLDPFTGSGTTGVTALRLGHRFLGFEIDPDYHRIALAKLERARRGEQLEICA